MTINFQKTYLLEEAYESIKGRAFQGLRKYLGYPDLITFNDLDGWRNHKHNRQFRKVILDRIRTVICTEINA